MARVNSGSTAESRPEVRRGALHLGVLVLTLAAFGLRLYQLTHFGFEGDETTSIGYAHRGLADILRSTSTAEPHPPLFYLFGFAWYHIVGVSEYALRYSSVIATTLA